MTTQSDQQISDVLVNVGASILAILILVVMLWVLAKVTHIYDRVRDRQNRRRH